MSGTGKLTAGTEYAGYSGTGNVAQSGGTNSVSGNLYLGYNSGSSGAYHHRRRPIVCLDGIRGQFGHGNFHAVRGTNAPSTLYLAQHGRQRVLQLERNRGGLYADPIRGLLRHGGFTQSGGTDAASGGLYLGHNSGPTGRTPSAAGVLVRGVGVCGLLRHGDFCPVGWDQRRLRHSLSRLQLGRQGDVHHRRRGVVVRGVGVCGLSGTGAFAQSAGTNTVSGSIYLGYNSAGKGTYTLNAPASLSAASEYVGYSGTGTFTQSAGINTASGTLYLGYNSTANATYSLSGTGQLTAAGEYVGYNSAAPAVLPAEWRHEHDHESLRSAPAANIS